MRTTFSRDDDAAALAQNYAKAPAPASSKPGSKRRPEASDGFERPAN